MKCLKCGAELEDGSRFCVKCGTDLLQSGNSLNDIPRRGNEGKSYKGIISVLVMLVVLLAGCVTFFVTGIIPAGSSGPAGDMKDTLNEFGVQAEDTVVSTEKLAVNTDSITLDKIELTLVEGKNLQLNAFITPKNADNKEVIWESDNPAIASVDENGNITANGTGAAVITVTTVDGKTATCQVRRWQGDCAEKSQFRHD